MFTPADLNILQQRGIDPALAESQLECFRRGLPPSNIVRAATPGSGIQQYDASQVAAMIEEYDKGSRPRKVLKFVPASGAATRMFKSLFEFRDRIPDEYDIELEKDRGFQSAYYLMNHLEDLPFSPLIDTCLREQGSSLVESIDSGKYRELCDIILDRLGYAHLPKGLLAFHRYFEGLRLACEEHLHEGAAYGLGSDGVVRIHFTVSPEHMDGFREAVNRSMPWLETDYQCRFDVQYSIQKPSTDTIAAAEDNSPFRDDNGMIVFRPGGHGALIENLNDLQGDIVFIKNIDNVVPLRLQAETVKWKKVLGAVLLRMEERIHAYLKSLNASSDLDDNLKDEIIAFLAQQGGLKLNPSSSPGREELINCLNRPIRVCGMVRNEGEPGGGPFWVSDVDGTESLQIVESAQIDLKQAHYKLVFDSSTHFNPVDLVCSLRDYKGVHFDLRQYVDPESAFISLKSSAGRTLKALELPGLWNGAMANWLTAFVEVPLITFNPVKTVNDLLREQHKA